MRILACSLLAVLVGGLSVVAQTSSTLTRPPLPNPETLQKMGLRQRWHGNIPMASSRDQVDFAQAFDSQILVQNASGLVTALDAETGARQWTLKLGDPYRSLHLPAGASSYTFCIVSGLKVYGIDRTNGLTQWSMDTPGTLATAVGMDDLRCYMATTKGGIHAYVMPLTKRAFEEKFGKEAAVPGAFNSSDPISNPSSLRTPYPLWNFQTDSQVALPPVLLPTQVVFANQSGVLYSFDRDKNKLGDRFYSASAITAPIGQHGNDMYVASQDYNVYNLELSGARLALRWQTTIHSRILAKPIVAGSDVYVVGVDQGLFCLDRLSGAVKWRQPKAETYLAASKRLVFAADKFNNTMCIDRDKGTILSTWDTRNWAHRLTNEYNDRLYLVNHDGQVVCLHDHDKSYEKPHKHNAPPPPKPEKKPMEEMPMEEKK